MKNIIETFKIKGSTKYVLVTTDIEDADKYMLMNTETGKLKGNGLVYINKTQYTIPALVWNNVPFFKTTLSEITKMGTTISGYPNYIVLTESKQVFSKKTYKFMTMNKTSSTFPLFNGKGRKYFTLNQILWMAEHPKDKIKEGEAIISANYYTMGNDCNDIVANDLVKISEKNKRKISYYKNCLEEDCCSVDEFFDKVDALQIEESIKSKLLQGILNRYC